MVARVKFLSSIWLLATSCLWPTLQLATPQEWETRAKDALRNGELQEARREAESGLADSRTRATAHELLGHIALRQERNEDAVSHFQAASAGGRSNPELEKDWAAALLNLGRQREACDVMEKSLSRDPSQVVLRYRLAGTYVALGKTAEALPHLEHVYEQGLRHAGVVMMLAQARFQAGQDEKAVELLESVAQTTASPDVLLEAGKLLFDRAFYKRAQGPLEKAWKLKVGSYEVGMYLALCHYMSGEYGESKKVLTAIRAGLTPPVDYRILLGSVFARLGRRDEARQELEAAIRQAPDRADGYLNLGLFYLEQQDRQGALQMLSKGSRPMAKGTKLIYLIPARVNCDGLAPPQVIRSEDLIEGEGVSQVASALASKEQLGSSLELFLLALEVDNRSAAAYAGIGKACWELGSFNVAQRFLERGLEFHPRDPELRFNLGLVYEWLNRTEDAIGSYQKAIQLVEPQASTPYWVQLGRAQVAAGKSREAEASFLTALDHDPKSGLANYELGKLYFQRKEFDRAEQSFEAALRLDRTLVGAYYEYGLTCLRNGKPEKGKLLLDTFNRKQEERADLKLIPVRR